MPDSPRLASHGEMEKSISSIHTRPCDFCGESTALLYCRADAAKLCLSCDREVHSTNQLFTKHTRNLLCDACDSSPSSIFCSSDGSVLCQNCDWERHNFSSSCAHDRRPLEGFTGCPLVTELLSILGFEDVKKKDLTDGDDLSFVGGPDSYGSDDGFSNLFVWNTPSIVTFTLDDLIVSSGPGNNYQAMGVPPLPKNRNVSCGEHKDEFLRQLRKMAKLDSNLNDDCLGIIESLCEFQCLVPEQNIQLQDAFEGFEHKPEPYLYSPYEGSSVHWCSDTGDVMDRQLPSLLGSSIEANFLVPEKDSYIGHSSGHANDAIFEEKSQNPSTQKSPQAFPTVPTRELNSQERETAISRYKEKKKSRRYDKHIRYETRKVRAESRTRIRGRFVKMDPKNTG